MHSLRSTPSSELLTSITLGCHRIGTAVSAQLLMLPAHSLLTSYRILTKAPWPHSPQYSGHALGRARQDIAPIGAPSMSPNNTSALTNSRGLAGKSIMGLR